MNTLQGKLRQRGKQGFYTYRLIVSNGVRQDFPLKTADIEEAIQKATELDKAYLADTHEELVAQMSAIRGFSKRAENLSFEEAWEKYQVHPERAMPHTVSEQNAYRGTFEEFAQFASHSMGSRKKSHTVVTSIAEVTPQICEAFSAYLKTTMLAVDTHNRKIKRLRKIFDCLKSTRPIQPTPGVLFRIST